MGEIWKSFSLREGGLSPPPLDQVIFFYEDCPTNIKDVTFENTKNVRQIPNFIRYNIIYLPLVAISVTVINILPLSNC